MFNVIVFGPPGCGKGTQSERIVEKYDFLHLSTGDLFRKEIKNKTALGELACKFIDRGLLIPDSIVMRELYRYALQHQDAKGIVLDGFPRTIAQAEVLNKVFFKKKLKISLVISIEVDDDELHRRIMGRAVDSGRSDDNPEVIKKRIEVYHELTKPVIQFYEERNLLESVSGMASIDEVAQRIDTIIQKKMGK